MSILRAILNFFREFLYYKEFFERELRSRDKSTTVFQSIRAVLSGFYSVSYTYYDLKTKNPKDYLSDWTHFRKINKINDKRKVILDDKTFLHLLEIDNPAMPKIIGIIRHNTVYQFINNQYIRIDINQMKEIIKNRRNGIIIKPTDRWSGETVTIIKHNTGDDFEFKGAWSGFQELWKNRGDFLITEVIRQTGMMADIYPEVLNTTRFLTMFDDQKSAAFIAIAAQRFGTRESVVVDNFDAGGLAANIDIEKGVVSSAARKDPNNLIQWVDVHPDTHKQIKGLVIPNWENIKRDILALSEKYYYIPYIGWDVALMDNGSFYIIEGNSNSGINIIQLEEGLLANKDAKMFFKKHGVIKN